ncbi:TetR/AcrR family transcriptional regulator [Dyella caseinilytica]|uniref:TetR/AcrR family transcriptional regulator n=1 Tax=Dyella caseinilytica TaxID=1849581 RepID=A0ABX7GS33_9GAMM|nr:TetR/AcrR family transcriptional regulator [Dyella caseinilytica]QRN53099.1 TetR/AcrR family transcriptional regulator [Dyella caseinilytica]GGA11454.1 TetR family transcriptional regulator [Dyella caseinilytica]
MPRKRLTREESREQTRLRLLDAAGVLIAKKGLAATSVEDIVAHAGYTRGAFYSNFKSKTDLFIELLWLDQQNLQAELQKLLEADLSVEDLQKQLALFYTQCYRDDSNYIVWAEARLHALRDTKFRQRMNASCLEKRDMIAYFIEQFCKRMNMSLPGPAADYALGTIALMDGMLYFSMTMPNELPDSAAESVLSTMFSKTFFGSMPS